MGYRGEIEKQNRARDLRAEGWTLSEICEAVGCSRSSASLWCRDVVVDEAVLAARRRQRLLNGNEGARQRGPNKLQRRKQAEIEAGIAEGFREIGSVSCRDLEIAALMLYAGEGAKSDGSIRLANTDPRLIGLFLLWLRRRFEIDESRLRVQLYLHLGLDLDAAVAYWAEITGIPPEQFTKPYRAQADPSRRRAKHEMGCPAVVYCCSSTHRRLMGMVEALLSSYDSDGIDRAARGSLPG